MITQELLKSRLDYNPMTGNFVWLTARGKGKIAGRICKKDGYVIIRCNNKQYYAHRLAFLYMTGAFPTNQVDHINRIRTDNRWDNLRDVDNRTNSANTKRNNEVVGVRFSSKQQAWSAAYSKTINGVERIATKSFSISKWGDQAKPMAIAARLDMENKDRLGILFT